MRKTLIKTVTKELWSIFFTSLFVFIFIVLSTRMIDMRTELVVDYNVNVNLSVMLKIILYFLPNIVLFSLPAACLMSVLLAFIRMSADNEIIALNSSGISLYQILSPVIIFSLISCLIASFLTFYWVPLGNRSFKSLFNGLVLSRVDFDIKERIFQKPVEDLVIYVNSYSKKQKIMKNIFLVDKSEDPVKSIMAEEGRIILNKDAGKLTIQLMKCLFFTNDGYGSFENYPVTIDLKDLMATRVSEEKDPEDMFFLELSEESANPQNSNESRNNMKLRLFEMFSIPLSIFFIGIIGAPLGAHVRAHGRTKGIVISLFVFLAYYVCMTGIRYLCERGLMSPSTGVWIPVIFLIITCIYLLIVSARNRPLSIGAFFRSRRGRIV